MRNLFIATVAVAALALCTSTTMADHGRRPPVCGPRYGVPHYGYPSYSVRTYSSYRYSPYGSSYHAHRYSPYGHSHYHRPSYGYGHSRYGSHVHFGVSSPRVRFHIGF